MEAPGTTSSPCPVPSTLLCTCAWCVLFPSVPPSLTGLGLGRREGALSVTRGVNTDHPHGCLLGSGPGHRLGSRDPERQRWKGTDSGARCGLGEETQPSPCDAACLLSWKPKPFSFEGPIKVQDIINRVSGRPPRSLVGGDHQLNSSSWMMKHLSSALTICFQHWLETMHCVTISLCSCQHFSILPCGNDRGTRHNCHVVSAYQTMIGV